MGSEFRLITALPVEVCVSRLVKAINYESDDLRRLHFCDGSKPFSGEVRENKFLLRKRTMGRNSFQTFASGDLRTWEGWTVVEGRFSTQPGFRLGYKAWGCLIIFLGLPLLISLLAMVASGTINRENLFTEPVLSKAGPLGMLCAPALLFLLGRLAASGQAESLRDFLLKTLEAREA